MRRYGLALLLLILFWFLLPTHAQAALTEEEQKQADSQSRYQLGQLYEKSGDLTRAEQYYQEALEIWPDNYEARLALQRLIDARTPPTPTVPDNWLGQIIAFFTSLGNGTATSTVASVVGWVVMALIGVFLFLKLGLETVRLAIRRARGIPLLALGTFTDPTGRLPGLPHQLASNMNDSGLTIYDEKGAIPPDFSFIGGSTIPQAALLQKMMELLYSRQVQKIDVDIAIDGKLLNASVSLRDGANSYVRYLHVVSVDQEQYAGVGELVKMVAQLIADGILIAISRDPNTRGLLYQRMGDWAGALKEFLAAAEMAKQKGLCGIYYQAHLNLGNLYSFLGLQDKSVAAYGEVATKAQNPTTLALIQAAMACSYKNWQFSSPPDQQSTYEWLARQAIDKALASTVRTPLIAYTIACYYSLAGQIEDCLRWLREAVAGDLAYLDYVLTDPDMATFRQWLGNRSPGEALGLRVG
ncbi:MAG: tetratricopeptide repeat protein [Mycobacterium leprae]